MTDDIQTQSLNSVNFLLLILHNNKLGMIYMYVYFLHLYLIQSHTYLNAYPTNLPSVKK